MNNVLNKIPVALRVLILILASIALGISLFWAYTDSSQIEPKLSVVTSLLAILVFGADIYSQLHNAGVPQTPSSTTSTQTHSGTGDIIAGDKVQGDKVHGNKTVR